MLKAFPRYNLLLAVLLSCVPIAAADGLKPDPSLRSSVPQRWWESAAGLKVVTLKQGRSYAAEVISLDSSKAAAQFDRIRAQGIQAIEIFAPAEGRRAYSGLDTINHYRIDPELGTMADFRRLVQLAHSKGLAVVIFHNIGYYSVEAPDWLEACDMMKAGKNDGKVKWFLWADKSDAPPPVPDDSEFYVNTNPGGDGTGHAKTWGWQYSPRAGKYYWSRWEARQQDGTAVGLPANNWGSEEWPAEAGRIVKFWMDTGIDGMLIDAPLFYTGLTWEKNNRSITDIVLSHGNTMVQPEGGRTPAWITEGNYNCIQDYRLRNWGGKWQQDSIQSAIATGDPRPIEDALKFHDSIVTAGAVLYQKGYNSYEEPARRHMARATLAAIGDMIVYTRGRGEGQSEPDTEETWILQTKSAHPALHNLSLRRKLTTNADDKYYALLRTARDGSERMVVALNYQPTPQTVEIDVAGVAAAGLLDVRNGEFIERHSTIKIDLPAYGYRFFTVVPPAK